ncbi:hypothetical protein HDU99_003131 [Rhizoclosmatium hyalinum]|nr:hypothetical protein HDU99_003131 [Rhizoclosmatium hyalinum]
MTDSLVGTEWKQIPNTSIKGIAMVNDTEAYCIVVSQNVSSISVYDSANVMAYPLFPTPTTSQLPLLIVTCYSDNVLRTAPATNGSNTRWSNAGPSSVGLLGTFPYSAGTLIGIGTDHNLYKLGNSGASLQWSLIRNSGYVQSAFRHTDGRVYGVGSVDKAIIVTESLEPCDWTRINGPLAEAVAQGPGNSFLIVDKAFNLYMTDSLVGTEWKQIPNTSIKGIAMVNDTEAYCIGTNNIVYYTNSFPTPQWVKVESWGVSSICMYSSERMAKWGRTTRSK